MKLNFQNMLAAIVLVSVSQAQDLTRFDPPQVKTNHDLNLRITSGTAPYLRLERSTNATDWEGLTTFKTTDAQYLDTGAPFRPHAIYRANELTGTNLFTGDHLGTDHGDVTFHPVNHASFVMTWNGLVIYNDPVGGAVRYTAFPRADLIFVSHDHTDHYDRATLLAARKTNGTTVILAPAAVYALLSADLKAITTVLTNGAGTNVFGIQVDAVPAYNSNHPKGRGNGYLLGLGGKRIYMTGDTGALDEMKTLPEIDVAFVCINVPYTMSVSQAAGIVRQFHPHVVYPYHYQNADNTYSDLNSFRNQLGTDRAIEVRTRKWY